jgi:hypothetical protein
MDEKLDKSIWRGRKEHPSPLLSPAEQEYREVGDASALHIIILDDDGRYLLEREE